MPRDADSGREPIDRRRSRRHLNRRHSDSLGSALAARRPRRLLDGQPGLLEKSPRARSRQVIDLEGLGQEISRVRRYIRRNRRFRRLADLCQCV